VAGDTAAKQVLAWAKNRLNKFYNPKLYKAAPKKELSAEDRISSNQGMDVPTDAKKSGESTGVISMIDLLIKDLEKELTEAKTEEKDAQADYEQLMKDAADKRTTDSKSLSGKQAAKADTEAALEEHQSLKFAGLKELMATDKYIASLHAECDWLVQYFDVRKQARAGEVDSLKKAKAVLSGADYSFIQVKSSSFLSRTQ